MKMYEETQPVVKYLNTEFECDCGKIHYAPIKNVDIRPDAIEDLPGFLKKFGYCRPYILCDQTTYRIAGEQCERILHDAGYLTDVLIINHTNYDEATLGEIVINLPEDCDLMIGVGTGSITDILRYASYKLKLPCFTVVTAAPMDGFSASVGIMNVNNLKATMPAHSTEIIIGDTNILQEAPFRMTIAGFGDLIGKINALNDWRLGVQINQDHYCRNIDNLVSDYVEDILGKYRQIKARDSAAIGDLLNALILTGASISLYGSSRPISGAEHHMSHYWEVVSETQNKQFAMHGEQVAVATVLVLMFIEEFLKVKPDFKRAQQDAVAFNQKLWEIEIHRAYGNAANAIIQLEQQSGKNSTEGRLQRITIIEHSWEQIQKQLNSMMRAAQLRDILKDIGSPCDPKDIGITESILRDTFLYCKETRARYTILQLAWDLSMLSDLTERVIKRLKETGRL